MKALTSSHYLFTAAALSAAFAACGSPSATHESRGGGGTPGVGGVAGSGAGPTGTGGGLIVGGGAPGFAGNGGVTELDVIVEIEGGDDVESDGTPKEIQITARYEDGTTPKSVVWIVDDTRVGSISQDGVFRLRGNVAGTVTVTVLVGSKEVSKTFTVTVDITDTNGIGEDTRNQLAAGGSDGPNGIGPDGNFRFLYPYDRTVFPQGLPSPELQLGGAAADTTLLEVTTTGFSYAAYANGSDPTRVSIPQEIWDGVTQSAGALDPVTVSVTKITGENVTGPVTQTYAIAQGSLKGIVYYNTYSNGGAVMRLPLGGEAEEMLTGCTVCHSVSSEGNTLVAGVGWGSGNPLDSASYSLSPDGEATERDSSSEGRKYAFGGLTPDGSRMLVSAVPSGIAGETRPRGLDGEYSSRFIDTTTGADVASNLADMVTNAVTPAFSHDGTRVAFNNRDESDDARVLSILDYDGSQDPAVFSGLDTLVDTNGNHVVAWPSFTPDGGAVLFHEGDAFDTARYLCSPPVELRAELRLVETVTKKVKALEALNGWTAEGMFYLPYGESEEQRLNYEPSLLPVAVGGYYWVMFTSRRAYGNTIAPGGTVAGGDNEWGTCSNGNEVPSPRKKIWVAAIDINYADQDDPSHPAFYLPGQAIDEGNMRAFAALEPCRQDGASCESGAECCGGFCRETGRDEEGNPILECVPPPENSCSNTDELCGSAADCCDPRQVCINRRCAVPPPSLK